MSYLLNPYSLSSLPIPNGPEFWIDAGIAQSYPGSGTSWYDLSGNNKHFTWTTTPSWTSSGNLSYFNLSNSYKATGPASNNINLSDSTGYTFFMVSSTDIDGNANSAFKVYNTSAAVTDAQSRAVFCHPGWTNSIVYFDQGGCCNANQRTEVLQYGYMRTTHLWIFRRSADGTLRDIWRDGVQIITNTNSSASLGTLASTAIDIGGTSEGGWRGTLSAFGSYSRQLNNTEITQLWNYYNSRGVSGNQATELVTTNLVFDVDSKMAISYPGSGTTWFDISGSGLNATGSTAISTSTGLAWNQPYNTASTSILNTDTHSLFFWLQINGTTGTWDKIFGYTPSGTDRSPGIWRYPSNRILHWRYDPNNTGADFTSTGLGSTGTEFVINTWYYVGVTKNGATATSYVNGSSLGTQTVSNPKTSGNSTIQLFPGYTGSTAYMGAAHIYNRVLSASEVLSNFNRTKARYGY